MAPLACHVAVLFVLLAFCRESLVYGLRRKSCSNVLWLKPTDTCTSLKNRFTTCTFKQANLFPCTASRLRSIQRSPEPNVCLCKPAYVPLTINTAQRNALLAMKKGLPKYATISPFSSWTGTDCRTWEGVECDTSGQVIGLSLNGLGLDTSLTNLMVNIVKLPALTDLDLSDNKITGGLPKSIANLKNLLNLDLSNNKITGALPTSIVSLQYLQNLDLSDNKVTGGLPTSIANLKNLYVLDLSNNKITGALPKSIANMQNLETLDLSNNKITGALPTSIANMQNLETLVLSNNKITGELPKSIANLRYLQNLDLSNNNITGALPTSIANLQNLQNLDLSNNKITGALPTSIANMQNLETLVLSNNKITGELPTSFANLQYLEKLYLSNNTITGKLPTWIANLKNLQTLDLSYNRLVGSIPTSVADIPFLSELYLNDNLLSGPLLLQFEVDVGWYDFEWILNFKNNFFSGNLSLFVGKSILDDCTIISGNCFDLNATLLQNCTQRTQRPDSECSQFCDALQPMGACGGHGICPGLNGSCICEPGYAVEFLPNTCTFGVRGRGLTTPPEVLSPKLNKFFRYASAGYISSMDEKPSWLVATSWNWLKQRAVQGVYDQWNCNTCWFVAAASAIESAFYISNAGRTPLPAIAMNQTLECSKFNSNCSSGGWPSTAFDFATADGLSLSANFIGTSSCTMTKDSKLSILSYERIKMSGWLGLLLALQQQPAVVAIEASAESFVNYNPLLGIYDNETCFSNGVNHAVVVVGYDLTAETPFWLIRNSWGPQWGDNGYMRIKISGGYGICGINTQPAFIPIMNINASDPCNLMSFARTQLKVTIGPGMMNPCGNGICIPNKSMYTCQCMDNFVAVNNTDGTATCAPVSPCTFTSRNPCGMGTCVDSNQSPGTYTCLCIVGYTPDDVDGSLTCVPAIFSSGPTYVVPAGGNISCSTISDVYGIFLQIFIDQNKELLNNQNLTCDRLLPNGASVNVTNSRNCAVLYAVNEGDTCALIRNMFNISDDPDSDISDLETLNPNLNCSNLQPFQQICVQEGEPTYPGPCTLPYNVQQGETCSTIIQKFMNGSATDFYALNPGIYCGRLQSSSTAEADFSQEVCLQALDLGSRMANCKGKPAALGANDNCPSLKEKHFKTESFKALNGSPCRESFLKKIREYAKGKKLTPNICVPK